MPKIRDRATLSKLKNKKKTKKLLQFINEMLANRSSMIVAERGSGGMTYAKTKHPLERKTCASRFSALVIR